jgi:integrase
MVRESWDPKEGPIAPKTRTSRRMVPMPGLLRDLFLDQRMTGDFDDDELVFGPFHATALYRRADDAWTEFAERLRLHQARHTYASFMIAAGVNAKALCSYMGQFLDQGDVRPLRAPDARIRGGGREPPRRLPRGGP